MREIKFRQRNKNNGQFHIWGMDAGIWHNPLWQDNYVHPNESDQFTGLEDKNGKDIFEGDIVLHLDEKYDIIIYCATAWLQSDTRQLALFEIDNTDMEVIGNIYESNIEELFQ